MLNHRKMGGISNAEIRKIRSLSQKKFRDRLGLFVVEGEKMVEELQRSAFRTAAVYRIEDIGEAAMRRISLLSTPSPVLALAARPAAVSSPEAPFSARSAGLFLALDALRDPGNLGTCLRVADWFGADAVLASEDTVDPFNPKVVQASMGSVFRVPFHYCRLPESCRQARALGGRVYGAFLEGTSLHETVLRPEPASPTVLVIGNEAAGISPEVAAAVTDRIFIPPYRRDAPHPDSLNAAVAAAVLLNAFRSGCR